MNFIATSALALALTAVSEFATAPQLSVGTINCTLTDDQGSQVCVDVTTTGAGNPVLVQVGPCSGGASSTHSPNPSGKARLRSDCFSGDSWQIRPLVDWGEVDECSDLTAKFIPC